LQVIWKVNLETRIHAIYLDYAITHASADAVRLAHEHHLQAYQRSASLAPIHLPLLNKTPKPNFFEIISYLEE